MTGNRGNKYTNDREMCTQMRVVNNHKVHKQTKLFVFQSTLPTPETLAGTGFALLCIVHT